MGFFLLFPADAKVQGQEVVPVLITTERRVPLDCGEMYGEMGTFTLQMRVVQRKTQACL